jgi:hypothetical protein
MKNFAQLNNLDLEIWVMFPLLENGIFLNFYLYGADQ